MMAMLTVISYVFAATLLATTLMALVLWWMAFLLRKLNLI